MDPTLAAVTGLRLISMMMRVQDQGDKADVLDQILAGHDTGKNVDAYMLEISQRLAAGGGLDDWTDIRDRISAEVDDFVNTPSA